VANPTGSSALAAPHPYRGIEQPESGDRRADDRVMVRDNIACNNLMVTDNVVNGLRVWGNGYTRNKMIARNVVANTTAVHHNVDTGQSVNECRKAILDANGL
jgi:hypothetical protein